MKYIFFLLSLFTLLSCRKELTVETPDFTVVADRSTIHVGDTVTFHFGGSAENISFYSGLPGNDYAFRERTQVDDVIPQLRVTTQYGGGGTQTESLRLMVSSTPMNAITKEEILAATWTDITSRGLIATNPTIVQSGVIDISDLVTPGQPIFFALKFEGITDPNRAAGNWIVPEFNAEAKLSDGTVLTIADRKNAGWAGVSVKNDANNWIVRANDLVIIGGGKNAPESEDWFVTRPLYFDKVSPDKAVPIQYISSNKLTSFQFTGYNQPGTYLVTFVASNASVDEIRPVVKQLTITVQP